MASKEIYVDIDKTICKTDGMNYEEAIPIEENIRVINNLYEKGHNITYWTARGTKSGINFFEVTEQQLRNWGAKYHSLKMGKPAYDLLIDDKAINNISEIELFLNLLS